MTMRELWPPARGRLVQCEDLWASRCAWARARWQQAAYRERSMTPRNENTPHRRGLERIVRGADLELRRESVVVTIPLFGAHELFVSCLRSVLRHTHEDVPILVADDASLDPASAQFLQKLHHAGSLRHRLLYFRQEHNVGFVSNVNTAFELARPADVVVLNSDCQVGPRWLDQLRDAAYSDSAIATASALTNHGTILSVPHRNQPTPALPNDLTVDEIALSVERMSPRNRPRIPTAIGHCFYVRRSASIWSGFSTRRSRRVMARRWTSHRDVSSAAWCTSRPTMYSSITEAAERFQTTACSKPTKR